MVYNEKRDIFFEGEATPEIIKTMRGEFKKFFIAELIRKKIVLIKPTNWQDW